MGSLGVVLLVVFVIICIFTILIVMVQNDESSSGGMFGSRTSTAFGSHSASVLTKTTFVLVALFIVTSFVLALLNKKPSVEKNLADTAAEIQQSAEEAANASKWWQKASDATSDASAEK